MQVTLAAMVKAGDAMHSSGEGLKAAGQRLQAGEGGGTGCEQDVPSRSSKAGGGKAGGGSAPRSKM